MSVKLEYITLFNFKSFSGKVNFGPLKDFSVIVGANGSGKSNIVDALSFVMGENARTLRAKRLRDLIHGANTGNPIALRAFVTASFTLDADRYRNFTRCIEKDSCEYQLNGQVISCEKYREELRKIGIIHNGRNCLVSQGTVESILMKSPKDLSAFFEELSGSIAYKDEYNRLNEEMRDLQHQMLIATTLKKSSLKSKNAFLKMKQIVEKYEMLNSQLMKLQSRLQLLELYHIKKELEDRDKAEKEEAIEIKELLSRKEKISARMKNAKKEAEKLSQQLEEAERSIEEIDDTVKSKEASYISVREYVVKWEAKLENAKALAMESRAGYEAHKRTIEELEAELKEINKMQEQFEESVATRLSSQGSSVELSHSQVSEYKQLKPICENESLIHARELKALEQEQDKDQCMLDNEERKKNHLKHKLQLGKMAGEAAEMRLKKLEAFITITANDLHSAMERKQQLAEEFKEYNERRVNIETKLNEIHNQLEDAVYNKEVKSRAQKLTHTLQSLQDLCGTDKVLGRVSELCRVVHSRYQIAAARVLGKYLTAIITDTCDTTRRCIAYLNQEKIGIETFLPLDNLKVTPLKENLRNMNIEGVKNVKLVYDVIQIPSDGISNALLFITENTLVCETQADARKVAWDSQTKHTCVALDGTLYRKNGTFTGGLADLERKVKLWKENDLAKLHMEETSLRDERRNLMPRAQSIESDINTTEIEIRGLTTKLKHSKSSLKEAMNTVAVVKNEMKLFSQELNTVLNTIASINSRMEKRNLKIRDTEKAINRIEDRIYTHFCRNIGIDNIRQYEQRHLIQYEEQAEKRLEFEKQCDRIRNMLNYERGRDMNRSLKRAQKLKESITQELEKARQEEAAEKLNLDKEKEMLQGRVDMLTAIKTHFADLGRKIDEYKEMFTNVSKLIITAEKKLIQTHTEIEEKKAAGARVMKNIKITGTYIPLRSDYTNASPLDSTDKSTGDSLLYNEILLVDFTKLPPHLKSDDVSVSREQLNSEIAEIQTQLNLIGTPDLKIEEKLDLTIKTLNEAKQKSLEILQQLNATSADFEQVKEKRLSAFNACFNCISQELEQAYKSLYKSTTATAMIVPENCTEPYLGGLHIHCIAPDKRWQPLDSLSGGEKTFASLALLCSFNSFTSAPFFVFDEVDASFDDVAVNNLLNYINEKKLHTRFIVVSHGKMKYYADALFGVTTEPDSDKMESTLVTLDLSDYPSPHNSMEESI